MTGHKPLDMKHFVKKTETEADNFRKQFEGKKFSLGVNGLGDIVNCETADKEIIKWLIDNDLTEI